MAGCPSLHASEPGLLTVATRSVPPFAFQDAAGDWQGIAITLWEQSLAEAGMRSRYVEVSLDEMVQGIADGHFDAAVGALSVTPQREILFDFSHPFYRTGLGVAVRQEDGGSWWAVARSFASPRFLAVVAALLGLLAFVGAVVWLLERRKNGQFPGDPVRGIGSGLWWSSVTMTTVGYGDKAPITPAGRAVALVWMFASLIIVSTITASLTTALTLDALSSTVEAEGDLARVRTGTIADSTSQERLQRKGIGHQAYPDADSALQALVAGRIDAVVYDRPLLRYRVRTDHPDTLQVLKLSFEPQDYAIGLPTGSALREGLNQGLLRFGRGPDWEALLQRYLGDD